MTTRSMPRIQPEDRVPRLQQAVSTASGNHYANIIVAQVDPDAIGAAFAMAEILQALGMETAIWYSGGFSHPQNRVIKHRFNLAAEMHHISKFSPRISDPETNCADRTNNFVLVDSNRGNDSRLRYTIQPFIVVDHHKGSDLLETEEDVAFFSDKGFLWLDENAGSASTMACELLQLCITHRVMPEDWKMTEKLATLLAMGIYTDTKNLISAGERDLKAYRWLSEWTTPSTIAQLIDYPLEEPNIQNLCHALQRENRRHQGAHLLSGMGFVDSAYADDLSTVADMMLRMPGVELSITWGGVRFENEETGEITIKWRVCARSQTLTLDLAEFLRKIFKGKCGAKQLPDGRSEGGAMFELNFDNWMKPEETLEIVGRRLNEWLFGDDTETANA